MAYTTQPAPGPETSESEFVTVGAAPTAPEASEVIQHMLSTPGEWNYGKACSAYEVNSGLCMEFSDELVERLPGAEIRSTPIESEWPGHQWVLYRGKHYDSEAPYGVEDWRDLPIFQRQPAPAPAPEHRGHGRRSPSNSFTKGFYPLRLRNYYRVV